MKFEVVGFDNKGSPQESLNTLKAAIDQGFRYITQGNGSGAGLALEAIGTVRRFRRGSVIYREAERVATVRPWPESTRWHTNSRGL